MLNTPNHRPLSVVVPYHKNSYGLVYILTMLQNQTRPPDKIVIIDTSLAKNGLAIAKMFSYNDVPVIVEVAQVNIYKAWNKGIDLSGRNSDVLIINDDIIFPNNFLQVMSLAIEQSPALVHVPQTSSRDHVARHIDQKFDAVCTSKIEFKETDWMPGFCFLLTRECIETCGTFDEEYSIWFGDDDYQRLVLTKGKINQVKGLFVYHFGNMSYKYGQKNVTDQIKKDRERFLKK